MKNRSRTEIIKLILESAAGDGITRSKIMYRAMLGYSQAKEYVTLLLQSGMIEFKDGGNTFKTTQKGIKFLQLYEEGLRLLNTSQDKDQNLLLSSSNNYQK